MAGSSQPWQGDRVVGSSLPNPYVGVRIAVFPRNGNVPGSWRWSALTVRSHFVLQMSVWGSRSDFSLIFHLEFLPTPKFSSQSRHKFTWELYQADLKDNYILQFLWTGENGGLVPFLPRLFNYWGIMECLHCNKTPECIQVPGDLLTCTQHWQSAARVRCAWWWWHHHFWQLSPTSVEWGNVPKIKTDSRINNDRFLEHSLCALNWSPVSSIRDCQKIIITLQHSSSKGHQQVALGEEVPAGRFGHTWTLTAVFSTGDGQVSQHLSSCHAHSHANTALGVQLESAHRDVAVSSWGRVQRKGRLCVLLQSLKESPGTHQT